MTELSKPKLTKEEKAAKKAAQEAIWEAQQQEALAAFKASLPARLKKLTDDANKAGLRVDIGLTETGPKIDIGFDDHQRNDILTYESEEWEVEDAEYRVARVIAEKEAYRVRKELAEATWSTLSPEAKEAVKEFIHYLKCLN